MKRISDYFSSTSSKKAKTEDNKPVDKPSESPTTSGDSVKPADKRNFQITWLMDARFKDWLKFDNKVKYIIEHLYKGTIKVW